MLGARRHRDKRTRQTISNDKADDSSQQVVTHIVEASSATADVDDAVLERHGVSEQPSATADVDDAVLERHGVSEQPSAIADVDDAVLKGMASASSLLLPRMWTTQC